MYESHRGRVARLAILCAVCGIAAGSYALGTRRATAEPASVEPAPTPVTDTTTPATDGGDAVATPAAGAARSAATLGLPPGRRVTRADGLMPGITPPPEPSQQVVAIHRSAIAPDVYARLMSRLMQAQQADRSRGIDPDRPPLPPAVPAEGALRRPTGDRRSIRPAADADAAGPR